jgi:beta-N-acetylhexosaminidase
VGAGSEVGLEAARRALRVEGEPAVGPSPLVVELVPEASIAAGPAQHGLADHLPGAEVVRVAERGRARPDPNGRPLVLVLRDAHRHTWERAAAEALAEDAVVVETGLPLWRPRRARAYVATHGAGRVNFQAAAERLRG